MSDSVTAQGKPNFRDPVSLREALRASGILETLSSRPGIASSGVDESAHLAEQAGDPDAGAASEFYSELNLNRFPFASLWDKDAGRSGSITVRQIIRGKQQDNIFEWIVTGGEVRATSGGERLGGLAGPFDRRVFRAIEKVVLSHTLSRGKPLSNPQEIHIKQILETLRVTVQTHNYRSVMRSLARLQATTITCSGIIRGKQVAPAHGITFSPISEIRWAGQSDPETGLRLHQTHLYFSPFYLDSVNSFNVRPIDWDIWLALNNRPLAQRFYEILEIRFFGLKDSPYASFDYDELCQILPTRRQKRPSLAMQVLDRAHEALRNIRVERPGRIERIQLVDRVNWVWDGTEARIQYFPNREYLARLRDRRRPKVDPRAVELAQEFDDTNSLAFYQLLVSEVDWQYISAARTEVRSNKKVSDPGKYFTATLRHILSAVGARIPFGSGGQ